MQLASSRRASRADASFASIVAAPVSTARSAPPPGRRAGCLRRVVAALLGVALFGVAGTALAGPYASTVIASGLNNPRGLAFGSDGALYVAEAGVASGTGPSVVVRGDPLLYTTSGSITRIAGASQSRVYSGLASDYNTNTHDVTGPNDIVFTTAGVARIAIGAGFDPTLRATLGPSGATLGRLLTPNGASFDVSAFEATNNPAGGPLDSNPWHLAPVSGGTLVTDAGGNSLLRVSDSGQVSSVAVFAARDLGGPFPTEAVPTGVAVGPDGAFYVGELTGFPFIPGSAQIFRVLPDGTSTLFATGFTQITDLAFGADGSLYFLEYDANGLLNPGDGGALYRIAPDGSRSLILDEGLVQPTGLEIGADGAFYVSNYGSSSGQGQVVRIAAVPEPATVALLFGGVAALGAARRWMGRRRTKGLST